MIAQEALRRLINPDTCVEGCHRSVDKNSVRPIRSRFSLNSSFCAKNTVLLSFRIDSIPQNARA